MKWVVPGVVVLLMACGGKVTVGDPNVEVASFRMSSDQNGALIVDDCVKAFGKDVCPTYPNPLELNVAVVRVYGNGDVKGTSIGGEKFSRVWEGIPIMCRVEHDRECVECMDSGTGAKVIDTCSGGRLQM